MCSTHAEKMRGTHSIHVTLCLKRVNGKRIVIEECGSLPVKQIAQQHHVGKGSCKRSQPGAFFKYRAMHLPWGMVTTCAPVLMKQYMSRM